jgi:hypothetical protein
MKGLRVIRVRNVWTTIIRVAGAAALVMVDSATAAAAVGEIAAADLVVEDFRAGGAAAGTAEPTVAAVSGAKFWANAR